MQRNTRRQTAAERRQADINLVLNGIQAMQNFMTNHPDDRYNETRARQLALLQDKLAAMTA